MKSFAVAVAAIGAVGASAQVRVRDYGRPSVQARGEGFLRQAMLVAHNAARADFGSPLLTWDERLAKDAKSYAKELARTGQFRHSTGKRGAEPEGENLWTGTRSAYSYAEMAGHWRAEQRDFRPGFVPQVSRTGRFEDVGHYTQMVWPGTTRLGCATASNQTDDYLVCRYAVPGNVVGTMIR